MSIRKLDMQERFASIFDDGSMSVHPEGYDEDRAERETWDKNEPNLSKQPKIAIIGFHVKEIVIDPTKRATSDQCAWVREEEGQWVTGCDNAYEIIDGSPEQNRMKFCCYCGKTIKDLSHAR